MTEFHFSPRPNRAGEIRWQPWSPPAFERAVREDKPVLLAISAVWCHWCHVMDETTYSDERVIAAINEHFVPVRVDNDVRPDINARYNMGGWPTTAFLAPDGMTITGATYLPAPDMLRALDEIAGFYAANKQTIAQRATELRERRRSYRPAQRDELQESAISAFADDLAQAYDSEYAGFGQAPKFPQPEMLEFLLGEHRLNGDAKLLEMVRATMHAMACGGMYDHVEGGFFRYSTTRDWSVPHFEKMSEDHAGLLRVLSQLAMLCDEPWIAQTLGSAAAYVRDVLRDPQTGFFAGSQDADETYFAGTAEERRAMTAPLVDRRSYSNWTAGLAGAGFAVARALAMPAIARRAEVTLDAMHGNLIDDDGLLYHLAAPGQVPEVRGLLGDQVAYVRACIDAHEAGGEARFLDRAQAIADRVIERFAAPDGGFYDRLPLEGELGNLTIVDRPVVDNGLFADALLRLWALTEKDVYREAGERTLLLYAKTFAGAGAFASPYVRALRRLLTPAASLRIVGNPEETARLRDAAHALNAALLSIRTVAPDAAGALGLPTAPSPAAYACVGTTCGAPVSDPEGLRAAYAALKTAS
ncbi:MAG TPA: DUF255 domain-containing protein [Verrucomicrobiae bacterium]|jgi:uncharacterized protein YyaL (SSP411 family)|nr:DUF255 domain-containing protein [Verrucomicrobiae bacterium]